MWYGRTGINLEIDLSQGKVEKKEVDPKLTESYLGGKGTNVKLFWDRVSPEVAPFSPDNLMVFGTGILTGTTVPGANRACISFKSPLTGLLTYSTFGGFWPAELKQAGYDTIAISGKSPTPVYLWINDDKVEIRDAAHLWGKDTFETQTLIREEIEGNIKQAAKRKGVQIACIGPAGENKVYPASIETSAGASASRAGIGTLMGDKKLKAIVVYGTKDINVAKPAELIELCGKILKRTDKIRENFLKDVGHQLVAGEMGFANFGNMETVLPPHLDVEKTGEEWFEFVEKLGVREIACYNCNLNCKWSVPNPDGGYAVFKCANWDFQMVNSKLLDFTFATRFLGLCRRYGLDNISISNIIAFAIDLYEKGILSKKDTEGMHLEWGNDEVFFSLLEKIARREGIGDVLANGVHKAARMIGKNAEEYAHHIKKLELLPVGGFWPILAFKQAISERGDGTRNTSVVSEALAMWPDSDKEAYMKSEYFHYPKEYQKYFDHPDFEMTAYEETPRLTAYNEDTYCLGDVTGICYFWSGFFPYPPIRFDTMVNSISYVTGMDIDEAEAMKIVHRIGSLVKSYNVRLGLRRKDDSFPKKFFRETPAPPLKTLNHDNFNRMIDEYYKIRGWNSEGIPTKERLDELDLDYVREDLERRGIL